VNSRGERAIATADARLSRFVAMASGERSMQQLRVGIVVVAPHQLVCAPRRARLAMHADGELQARGRELATHADSELQARGAGGELLACMRLASELPGARMARSGGELPACMQVVGENCGEDK
jgi:hypothetical protein